MHKKGFLSHRPVVMGTNWMITSGHPLASQAGAAILERGGKAIDAAIAANAVLCVVRPHMCGLGGDAFIIFYQAKDEKVEVLNASGRAPFAATREFFVERGFRNMPERGMLTATVPGVVDGWVTALEKCGSFSLAELLQKAIFYAEKGFPVYKELSQVIAQEAELLNKSPDAWRIFFKNGQPPQPGEILAQPELAASFKKIACQGRKVFYEGEIAEALINFSREAGGLFSEKDFIEHKATWVNPIETTYRGYRVLAIPPNSQGVALLMQLNIIEKFDLEKLGHNSADYVHLLVEAKKLAFADRDRYVCDPDFHPVPIEKMIAKGYGFKQGARIDFSSTASTVKPAEFSGAGGDTIYLAVVDKEGNAVSMIQSLYEAFGSGVMVKGTGILLHNRGKGFNLEAHHPNCLQPHKRPYHTLSPCLVMKDEFPFMVLGTPGADGQTQTITQVLANFIDFGADIQEAIEAPRWRSFPGTRLAIEDRFPAEVFDKLKSKGHELEILPPYSAVCGGAQGIVIDHKNGVLMGGADPRRHGYVIGS